TSWEMGARSSELGDGSWELATASPSERRTRSEERGRKTEDGDQRSGWNPIRFVAGVGGMMSCLIAAKTVANFSSYFFSKLSILRARVALLSISRRSCTKVRIIAMFTSTAR